MREISGVLLALAVVSRSVPQRSPLKITATGVVAVRRCKTRARGAEAVKEFVVTKSTATWSTIIAAIARVMHAPIAGAGAVRVPVAASGTMAAKKSAVSQTSTAAPRKVAAVCAST